MHYHMLGKFCSLDFCGRRGQSTSRTARLPTIKPLSLEPGAAPLPPLVSWETQR